MAKKQPSAVRASPAAAQPTVQELQARLDALALEHKASLALLEQKDAAITEIQDQASQAWSVAEQFRDQASQYEDQLSKVTVRSTDAIDNPVVRTTRHDATEQFDMGSAYFSDGGSPIDMMIPQIVTEGGEAAIKHEEEMQFQAQPVVIQFATSSERNAQQVFPIGHQGRRYLFERGKKYKVPRFIVSQLLDMMTETFGNTEYMDTDGVKKVKYPGSAGLRFQFSVLQDSDEGLRWFSRRNKGYSREVFL